MDAVEKITINGREFQLQQAEVPLDSVELDGANPRIKYKYSLEVNGRSLDDVVLAVPEVRQLKRDIEHSGGLRERVYLQQLDKGRYLVKEGNCRTVCYRKLREDDPKNPLWKKLPARILPNDITPREIAILLSDWHVAGKIGWDAHEKAGHIYYMATDLNMNLDDIALHMRASKSSIVRWKDAYHFMSEIFLKTDKGAYAKDGERKWSYFDEFFKKKELREEYKADPEFGGKFARWVGDGRVGPPKNVRLLAKIIGNPKARKKFDDGASIEDAYKIIQQAEPEEGSDFFTLMAKVRNVCTSAASLEDVLRVREDDVARKRFLDTYRAMVKFMELADLHPDEEKD